jgi:hypothetical protein
MVAVNLMLSFRSKVEHTMHLQMRDFQLFVSLPVCVPMSNIWNDPEDARHFILILHILEKYLWLNTIEEMFVNKWNEGCLRDQSG